MFSRKYLPQKRKAESGESETPLRLVRNSQFELQLLEEFAGRARDVNPARNAAFAVFDALDDARRLAALGAIGALSGVHDLLAVGCFCDFRAYCHV
jgi:hypothetical protein